MNLSFFLVGGIIFSIYIALTFWNIFYSNKKQQDENYPTPDNSEKQPLDSKGNTSKK